MESLKINRSCHSAAHCPPTMKEETMDWKVRPDGVSEVVALLQVALLSHLVSSSSLTSTVGFRSGHCAALQSFEATVWFFLP